jgi:hypothetical protein
MALHVFHGSFFDHGSDAVVGRSDGCHAAFQFRRATMEDMEAMKKSLSSFPSW